MINTQDNLDYGDENLIKERLKESATYIREKILGKPIIFQPFFKIKSNVAVAEVYVGDVIFCAGTTSNYTTLIPILKPKSEGGQFNPQLHPRTKRPTNTDAEYKVLSTIADTIEIEMKYDLGIKGYLYLYTERNPCPSCEDVIRQFEEKFRNIKVKVFWDYLDPK